MRPPDSPSDIFLPFPGPLLRGTLIRRYKRFLVDVRLRNHHVVTAHTPNTGSMAGCSEPGSRVFISRSPNLKRKLPYTLELVESNGGLVGINTLVPNRLYRLAAEAGALVPLGPYATVKPEVRVSQRSRIDLKLSDPRRRDCFVEIKNVTLVRPGEDVARFPDAVTSRGARHLDELAALAEEGNRAVILFAVQRGDAEAVGPADDIDPHYGETLRRVMHEGVEALAYRFVASEKGIALGKQLPVVV
jgi:sugar fermentation stimulation protein A